MGNPTLRLVPQCWTNLWEWPHSDGIGFPIINSIQHHTTQGVRIVCRDMSKGYHTLHFWRAILPSHRWFLALRSEPWALSWTAKLLCTHVQSWTALHVGLYVNSSCERPTRPPSRTSKTHTYTHTPPCTTYMHWPFRTHFQLQRNIWQSENRIS